ncbi:hypothetical protein BAY60_25835 [Prauserella muralis]|uniref:DUF4352 domain-containing protein n=1 Tax=Prauserella muralis TaxID=588067 RepID=A0A2V4AMI3_9PSEU|nr:hypothetical protein BAY60_25835 [Prauserella muralis]
MAACALLALTACGPTAAGEAPASTTPEESARSGVATSARPAATATAVVRFGSDHRFPSGLVVAVSTPKTFQPSDAAYPRAERAAAFGIAIYNETQQPYRLSSFSVRATIDERQATQVVDATQGYNGIVDADRDVPPGGMARLTFAFAVPADGTPLRLIVRPDNTAPTSAVYSGSV